MNFMTEVPIPQEAQIVVNGEAVRYQRVTTDAPGALRVAVDKPQDSQQVDAALQRGLLEKYWFLAPEYRKGPSERFEVGLAEGAAVDVFSFQERDLTEIELARLGGMLSKFYHSLKKKDDWKLESIQIHAEDQHNPKSGQFMRGQEVPSQRRFKLFPAAFGEGNYRDTIDTSWLEGTVGHETTHVVLERPLERLWNDNAEELGWQATYDTQITLPGGHTTFWYNKFPSKIPTEYGTLQQDDDRAESVVQYLTDFTKLDAVRAAILSNVLLPNVDVPPPTITALTPELPKMPLVSVVVEPKRRLVFSISQVEGEVTPPPIVPLAEFRRQNSIISNHVKQ
jgi:hypothetical protein